MKIAIIDLGTNTFNLLIAEIEGSQYKILLNTKKSVKLGKGGIHNNVILPDAMMRAAIALEHHFDSIAKYKVDEVVAIGTSALRTAANSDEFVEMVFDKFNTDIEIISGEREAELIYLGVKMSLDTLDIPFLVLDIGGGSNEFVISQNGQLIWKESFPLGMARLIEQFKLSDPVKSEEIDEMERYFNEALISLFQVVEKYPVRCLVGAEGAFESFYNYISYKKNPIFIPKPLLRAERILKEDFIGFYKAIINSTSTERLQMRGIELYRIEMVVPSAIFVKYIIDKLNIEDIMVSGFSLKEGILYEKLQLK